MPTCRCILKHLQQTQLLKHLWQQEKLFIMLSNLLLYVTMFLTILSNYIPSLMKLFHICALDNFKVVCCRLFVQGKKVEYWVPEFFTLMLASLIKQLNFLNNNIVYINKKFHLTAFLPLVDAF